MKPRRRSIDIGVASIAPFERKRGVMAAGRERRGGRVGRTVGWVQTMQELLPPWRYVGGVLGTGPQRAGVIVDNSSVLSPGGEKEGKVRKEKREEKRRIGRLK